MKQTAIKKRNGGKGEPALPTAHPPRPNRVLLWTSLALLGAWLVVLICIALTI